MTLMNSKEKVLNALNHIEGEVPFDLGTTGTTGIHCTIVEGLRDYYGLEKHPVTILEPYQMLGLVEDDLKEVMGVDTDFVWNDGTMFGFKNRGAKEWKTPWGQVVLVQEDFNTTTSPEGEVLIYAEGDMSYPPCAKMPEGGYFFDSIPRGHSFDENNPQIVDNLEEFGDISDETLGYLKNALEKKENSGRALIANVGGTAIGDIALVPAPMLKNPKGLRDISEWYMATLLHQDYLHQIFEKETEIALRNLEKAYKVLGDKVMVNYVCGTDFGTQNAPFLSNDVFKSLYAPYYKKINNWIHENTSWKTFKHCCGSIKPLIPELIDAGFDILNPVQWTANNMEAKELKAEFGKDITFWGGGVNTQKTLPFGTPAEVRAEALNALEVFSKGGGYVFNTIHNIQALTPVENVVAFAEAVKEFNGRK